MPAAVPAIPATPRGTSATAGPRSVSFVEVLQECRKRPSLLALELLWRWGFGIPLLAAIAWEFQRIAAETAARVQATGANSFSLDFPMKGALALAQAWTILWTPVAHLLGWLVPAALVAWAMAAGVGRNLMLRRYDRSLPWRPGPMIVLQLLRAAALCTMVTAWFGGLRWAADYSLSGVSAASETSAEPSLVLYLALVIAISLGCIAAWLLLSWVFSIAPAITLLERCGVGASLRRSVRLGRPLVGKLVEINIVIGFLKLALTVMVMVLTATPAAFVVNVTGIWLYVWFGAVSVLYMALSDFCQVARMVAFVQLWRAGRAAD